MKFEEDTPEARKLLQQAAREEMKHKLLADIAMDIQICQLEGWGYKEYLEELRELIGHFLEKSRA